MAYNHAMHLPDNPDAALLERVEAFLKAHEGRVSARQLGIATMKDSGLVGHLRKGRSLSLDNARKVLRFIEDYRPEESKAA